MPETIHYNVEEDLIEVRPMEALTEAEWRQDLADIAALRDRNDCKSVYVNLDRLVYGPSTAEVFHTVAAGLPEGLRYALVVAEGHALENNIQFLETTALNRGVSLRLFRSREQAIAWLRSGV